MQTPEIDATTTAPVATTPADETPGDARVRPARRPLHPYIVLVVAILLPGMGQVLNGNPRRGLTMLFFMLALGFLNLQLAAPERSFVGRHAGGVFVYAIAVFDAYAFARYRWEVYRRNPGSNRA